MIKENMLIIDILKKYPKTSEVFNKYNMACASCLGVQGETLKKGCLMHGHDVNVVIAEMNQLIK